jgi:hypothetical protein
MTESARREANRCHGLEGHNCYRLYRRRSDLFHHHALCVRQFLGEGFDSFESSAMLDGCRHQPVGSRVTPDRPHDPGELVGDGDCSLVVHVSRACSPTPAAGLAAPCARE